MESNAKTWYVVEFEDARFCFLVSNGILLRARHFLADIRFHRTLWIVTEADADSSEQRRLRVTYSDIGDECGHPIIFCGGMFGSRYALATADQLAKEHKIRLICPDKFGIGGSQLIDINKKIMAWLGKIRRSTVQEGLIPFTNSYHLLDVVKGLVKQLKLGSISLLGHSSGAMYVLNAAFYLRHLLHPSNPYIALLAPWVYPWGDGSISTKMTRILPILVKGGRHNISQTIASYVTPTIDPGTTHADVMIPPSESEIFAKAIDQVALEYCLQEETRGVSQEAQLCLKGGDRVWGPWANYNTLVSLLMHQEMRIREGGRLMVDVLYAQSDSSIGMVGAAWFDGCWINREDGDWIEFRSCTIWDTTHETILKPHCEALGVVFADASERVGRVGDNGAVNEEDSILLS